MNIAEWRVRDSGFGLLTREQACITFRNDSMPSFYEAFSVL